MARYPLLRRLVLATLRFVTVNSYILQAHFVLCPNGHLLREIPRKLTDILFTGYSSCKTRTNVEEARWRFSRICQRNKEYSYENYQGRYIGTWGLRDQLGHRTSTPVEITLGGCVKSGLCHNSNSDNRQQLADSRIDADTGTK